MVTKMFFHLLMLVLVFLSFCFSFIQSERTPTHTPIHTPTPTPCSSLSGPHCPSLTRHFPLSKHVSHLQTLDLLVRTIATDRFQQKQMYRESIKQAQAQTSIQIPIQIQQGMPMQMPMPIPIQIQAMKILDNGKDRIENDREQFTQQDNQKKHNAQQMYDALIDSKQAIDRDALLGENRDEKMQEQNEFDETSDVDPELVNALQQALAATLKMNVDDLEGVEIHVRGGNFENIAFHPDETIIFELPIRELFDDVQGETQHDDNGVDDTNEEKPINAR